MSEALIGTLGFSTAHWIRNLATIDRASIASLADGAVIHLASSSCMVFVVTPVRMYMSSPVFSSLSMERELVGKKNS